MGQYTENEERIAPRRQAFSFIHGRWFRLKIYIVSTRSIPFCRDRSPAASIPLYVCIHNEKARNIHCCRRPASHYLTKHRLQLLYYRALVLDDKLPWRHCIVSFLIIIIIITIMMIIHRLAPTAYK